MSKLGKTRNIPFDYFVVACRDKDSDPNVPDEPFDLNFWIEVVESQGKEDLTKMHYDDRATLESLRPNILEGYWFFCFARLRNTNIPKISSIDKVAREIDLEDDEFIAEDVNAIYDQKHGIFMLQRNRNSLGARGIEQYINTVWDNRRNKIVYLRPIQPKDTFKRATKKGLNYRKFNVRFADVSTNTTSLNTNKSFKKIIQGLTSYNGVNIEVIISMGRSKEGLNNETIVETLYDLAGDLNSISKIGVSVKDGDEPIEILDLLADKITDYIPIFYETRKTLSSEYAERLMYEKYCESKPKILNSIFQ